MADIKDVQFMETETLRSWDYYDLINTAKDVAEAILEDRERDQREIQRMHQENLQLAWDELRSAARAAIPAALLDRVIWDESDWHPDKYLFLGTSGDLITTRDLTSTKIWEFAITLPGFAPIKARFEVDYLTQRWHQSCWIIAQAVAAQDGEDGDELVHLEHLGRWMYMPSFLWADREDQRYLPSNLMGALAWARIEKNRMDDFIDQWQQLLQQDAQQQSWAQVDRALKAANAELQAELDDLLVDRLGDPSTTMQPADLSPEEKIREALGEIIAQIMDDQIQQLGDRLAKKITTLADGLEKITTLGDLVDLD